MSDEIFDMMEESRLNKTNVTEYRRIRNNIRRKIREVKYKEKEDQCAEIKFQQRYYEDFNVHK